MGLRDGTAAAARLGSAVVAAFLGSACQGEQARTTPAPTLVVAPRERVSYRLELLEPETPIVGIHVEAPGDADGVSEFTLAEGWAGVAESGKDLELVEARGGDENLAVERVSSYTWRVQHAPLEPLALTFELGPTRHRASLTPPEYYLPILEAKLLHALGAQTLPAPEHLDGGVERPITLAWSGFTEAGWKVASSFGAGADERELALPLDAFRHALFLAGDLRLEERSIHGRPLQLSIFGEWGFSDQAFGDLAARVVTLGREFFDDYEKPYYLISLIPIGGGKSGSTGGTGLTDSFALFSTHEATLSRSTPDGGGIDWLLCHELFHEWNGHVITLAQPEQLGYWFSEGFTDFYARALLQRSGMIDDEAFVAAWNAKLSAQAANPERFAPAERVRSAFWSSREVGELPYQRGDLIALYVDAAIRQRSGGARSLDDLMRVLVERARAGGAPHTSATLADAIAEFAGRAAADAVLEWALAGVEAPLPADAVGPGFELSPAKLARFDTGFDHEATFADGIVKGVRPGGCAERAGLRDGMRIARWSVRFGQVDQPIVVCVREGNEERELSYLPQGAPVRGYRLSVR